MTNTPPAADPVPDPAARLQAAADHLRALLAAIATESAADLPLHADGRTVTQGRIGLHPFAMAETPEVAAFITAMGPLAGHALVQLLETEARVDAEDRAALRSEGRSPAEEHSSCTVANCTTEAALAVADAILAGAQPTSEAQAVDTLPEWLYWRFACDRNVPWDELHDDIRSYWAHEAAAVRRAVARGGFKNPEAGR